MSRMWSRHFTTFFITCATYFCTLLTHIHVKFITFRSTSLTYDSTLSADLATEFTVSRHIVGRQDTISAQSRQSWIHFAILFMSSACRQQLLTQISRASKQALQAYIQLWYYSFCNTAVTCNWCIAKYLIATNNP